MNAQINRPFQSSSSIQVQRVCVAEVQSFAQQKKAYEMVYQEYRKCGYIDENDAGVYLRYQQLLPGSFTFQSTIGSQFVGTASIVLDTYGELPSSSFFGNEFQMLRQQKRRIVEGTLLSCVGTKEVPAHVVSEYLISYGIMLTMTLQADDFCVVINPKHLKFWRDVLGFEVLSESRSCEHVKGNPGILMRFDVSKWCLGELNVTKGFTKCIQEKVSLLTRQSSSFSLTHQQTLFFLENLPESIDTISLVGMRELWKIHPLVISCWKG